MLWSTYQSSCSYSLRHWQMFTLTGSKLLHWYYLAGMVFLCMCVHTEVSKGQLAGCGLQRWLWLGGSGGETAGVAAIRSQVLPVTSTPQLSSPPLPPHFLLSVSILSGGEMAFVMGRGWQLSCTSVSMPLSQSSPLGKSTCSSLAQLQRSSSTASAPLFSPSTVHMEGVYLKWLWQSFEQNWSMVLFGWF